MKILEKQKEQKLRLSTLQTTSTTSSVNTKPIFKPLTVTIQNESRSIQAIDTAENTAKNPKTNEKNDILIDSTPISSSIDSVIEVSEKSDVNSDLDKLEVDTTTEMHQTSNIELNSIQNEQSSNKSIEGSSTQSESIASQAKKTPKIKPSVLVNYIKRYRNQR